MDIKLIIDRRLHTNIRIRYQYISCQNQRGKRQRKKLRMVRAVVPKRRIRGIGMNDSKVRESDNNIFAPKRDDICCYQYDYTNDNALMRMTTANRSIPNQHQLYFSFHNHSTSSPSPWLAPFHFKLLMLLSSRCTTLTF